MTTNVKNSKYNNTNSFQNTLQGVYSTAIDSNFNQVDTSLCTNFTVKIPTGNKLVNQSSYETFKNETGVDIYNKTEPFFNDICYSFSKDNSDIVLE